MDAYSLDLRKKIVEAKQRGTPTVEVARTFGVGVSSVKRYAAAAREGRSLAPKRHPGSKPKLGEAARKLLEADLAKRPAATLSHRREFLRGVAGVSVSDSTISGALGRLGWTRKKDRWERRSATSSRGAPGGPSSRKARRRIASFSWMSAARTHRCVRSRPGRGAASGRSARRRATGAGTSH